MARCVASKCRSKVQSWSISRTHANSAAAADSVARRVSIPTARAVWLVIERPAYPADVNLNESRLGTASEADELSEFDITAQLRGAIELVLDFDAASQPLDRLLFADVRLEIRG